MVAQALIGIPVAVVGGWLGIHVLLYITLASGAGYVAYAANRAWFGDLSTMFGTITSDQNAGVIGFAILTLIPLISIGYGGVRFLNKLFPRDYNGDVVIPRAVDAVMGVGFALTVYLIMLAIR